MINSFKNNNLAAFGNTARDNIIQFQVDNEAGKNLSVTQVDNQITITMTSKTGKVLGTGSFKLVDDTYKLIKVDLAADDQLLRFYLNNGEVLTCSVADIYQKISAEKARAIAAETDLSNAIATETTRAKTTEGDLSALTTDAKNNLVSAVNEVDLHIDNEVVRAKQTEGNLEDLTTEAKTNLVAAINDEVASRKSAIDSLNADVSGAGDRVKVEVVETAGVLQSVTVTENDIAQKSLLDAEIDRAKGVEGTLSSLTTDAKNNLVSAVNEVDLHIDTEVTDRKKAIEDLDANITGESARVKVQVIEADGKITNVNVTENDIAKASDLASEVNRATTTEGKLSDLTTDKKDNLVAAINEVDKNVDDEVTNRKAAIEALDSDQSGESDRVKVQVTEEDGKLTSVVVTENDIAQKSKLDSEVTRATTTEGSLADLTTDAKTNLVAAINEVDNHIDAEVVNRENAIKALDSDKTGESARVKVQVVEEDGKVSSVTVTENDIAQKSLLDEEVTRATTAESTLQTNINKKLDRVEGITDN